MIGFFSAKNNVNYGATSAYSAYNMLFMLAGLTLATYGLARWVESTKQLNYKNPIARIIAGFLILTVGMLHTKNKDFEIINTDSTLITVGPHRTGWEAVVLASKMRGTPPRFFATDMFNNIPGISTLMGIFKVIPVEAKASKGDKGQSANSGALEKANKALEDKECVVLFPQGGFSKLGEEPRMVYPGAAKLALKNKIPIVVIRLDGYWSLQNPLIPICIRNSLLYRSFLSGFHMNNVRTTLCCVIDFHLKPENDNLNDKEKIEEINAQLYAYYRPTEELTANEIDKIKIEITSNTHRSIWTNKVHHENLQKERLNEKKAANLEINNCTLSFTQS